MLDNTARHDLRIRGSAVRPVNKFNLTTSHAYLVVGFINILCHYYTTTTWKCIISRFTEDVNKRRRTFFLDEFAYIWKNKQLVIIAKKFERMQVNVLLKSDVLTAVAVVVPWTGLRASPPWRSGGEAGKGRKACNYLSEIWISASKK